MELANRYDQDGMNEQKKFIIRGIRREPTIAEHPLQEWISRELKVLLDKIFDTDFDDKLGLFSVIPINFPHVKDRQLLLALSLYGVVAFLMDDEFEKHQHDRHVIEEWTRSFSDRDFTMHRALGKAFDTSYRMLEPFMVSEDMKKRFFRIHIEWIDSTEEKLCKLFDNCHQNDMEYKEFFRLRLSDGGYPISLFLTEMASGFNMADIASDHKLERMVKKLNSASEMFVILVNDIYSFRKEFAQKRALQNYLYFRLFKERTGIQETCDDVVTEINYWDLKTREFSQRVIEINECMNDYVKTLHGVMDGSLAWTSRAPRYNKLAIYERKHD